MNEALFWIILTILLFSVAMFLYQRHPRVWTLPILTVTAVLILILVYSGVSHAEYMQGG
ncbi:LrgB family protein, partial [Exiguobacterium sp.]